MAAPGACGEWLVFSIGRNGRFDKWARYDAAAEFVLDQLCVSDGCVSAGSLQRVVRNRTGASNGPESSDEAVVPSRSLGDLAGSSSLNGDLSATAAALRRADFSSESASIGIGSGAGSGAGTGTAESESGRSETSSASTMVDAATLISSRQDWRRRELWASSSASSVADPSGSRGGGSTVAGADTVSLSSYATARTAEVEEGGGDAQ